jgi:hypothetical protein
MDEHARAASDSELVARVSELLANHWDPSREFVAPNGSTDPSAHAKALLAIIESGGPAAELVGYLRRAEEVALEQTRTRTGFRWAIATTIWRWSRGLDALPNNGGDVDLALPTDSPYSDSSS